MLVGRAAGCVAITCRNTNFEWNIIKLVERAAGGVASYISSRNTNCRILLCS